MKKVIAFLVASLLSVVFVFAVERVSYTVNEAWEFSQDAVSATDATAKWIIVNIPHTWNSIDSIDDEPGMYRGSAWYRKTIRIPQEFEGRRAVLYFEGANQETEVYVNGSLAGRHVGGYTRFCFDVTDLLTFGAGNVVAVKVDNSYNPDIPPLSADFTFFGGIYRDVWIKFLDPIHFATDDYATSGVYIKTPNVSHESATVQVTALLTNNSSKIANVILQSEVRDASGNLVASTKSSMKLPAGETVTHAFKDIVLSSPHLWDIDDPYLYRLYTRILDKKTGDVLDEVSEPLGLRWFSFDPDEGFFLNGTHRKLIGTCRHQDFKDMGNALRDEYHVQDVMLIKQMGGNFLRVSHYPQDPIVLEMCDRLGIVTSVEIPVINAVTESEAFHENSLEMVVEMVRQDYNHPSVVIWAYMNEILLLQPYPDGDTVDLPRYYECVERVARDLDDKIREEDPSRYTMMAFHGSQQRYDAAHLTSIPMISAWNLYQGWYEPDINEFQNRVDKLHQDYPDKVLFVTEYGPGVDVRLHSYSPERFDFSQEYGLYLHMHYAREIVARPFIAGSSLWNLNDFYSEQRIDTNPHVNNKGIVSQTREKKDSYLFYSALLCQEPYLAIGQREWKYRGGLTSSASGECVQTVPVFSNAASVSLSLNGYNLGSKAVVGACAFFDVPFRDGKNILVADADINGAKVSDMIVVDFKAVPEYLGDDFQQMNVMLGSPRYFDDRLAGLAWIPEKEYASGSWGYVGGEPFRRPTGFGTMLGTDKDILGTDQDPIFQTQRLGLEAFKADVPDGEYSVYLYWADINSETGSEALVYNLGADAAQSSSGACVFDVRINGTDCLKDFNLTAECGAARAVIRKFKVTARDGEGITVSFDAKTGEPFLNAIRIFRD